MVTQLQISVRSAEEQDRKQLASLVHFETYVHRHLDWRPPLDWMGYHPYLVAEGQHGLLGALVCPPDPPDVAWIRLFAISSEWSVTEAWQHLWPQAQYQLSKRGDIHVAAIPLQEWFRNLLGKSQFHLAHNIVVLTWERGSRLPSPPHFPVTIRPMNLDDLPAVEELDWAAFGQLWRNSLESLQLAFKQSALATVAEDERGLLGYQISTASPMGGHLARLAVLPEAQSKGIGYGLVYDLLNQFERRGAIRVTVNTQEDNASSLSLYRKANFRRTGEMYPVYQFDMQP